MSVQSTCQREQSQLKKTSKQCATITTSLSVNDPLLVAEDKHAAAATDTEDKNSDTDHIAQTRGE